MNIRQQIEANLKELADNQALQNSLREREWEMLEKSHDLIRQMVKEESLLAGSTWHIRRASGGHIYLEFDGDRFAEPVKQVAELCAKGWHGSFKLEQGVRLDFDDLVVTLNFDDPKQVSLYAQQAKLIVKGSDIKDELHLLRRQISTIETICHQFDL